MGCIKNILPIFIGIIIIGINLRLTFGVCNPISGPAGAKDCVFSPSYNGPQISTCWSSQYIMQITGGRHRCISGANYCYYQCMLAVYGMTGGMVEKDCQCNMGVIRVSGQSVTI